MIESLSWERIESAFDEVLGMPACEWPGAVERIAAGDPELRRELESLLAQVGEHDPLLDHPLAKPGLRRQLASREQPGSLESGTQVGPYRILAFIGRGGMGEVYRAKRADGQFEQNVALKLIQREAVEHLERFQTERQILARLEHPGIARLLDGGLSEDGRPYMVMELVAGLPIVDWCREDQSDLKQILTLFLATCDAVAYAHTNLIVHRDLKPSNLMVTTAGAVKLLDFGVAKLIRTGVDDRTRNAPLTPAYAAPEQLTQGLITTATDVYALGLLLFELLTDTRPWEISEMPVAVALDKLLHEDPRLMSEVAARPSVPAALLRGDLDAIVAKALRKEPEQRYATVAALQSDIARSMRAEPVSAREGARLYVVGRFVKRHRMPLAVAVLVTLLVIGGAISFALQAERVRQEAARATAVKDFLIQVFRASDPRIANNKPRGQMTARDLLDRSTARIDTEFKAQPELQLELLGIVDNIYGYLNEDDRYDVILQRRVSLARSLHGDHDPVVIGAAIDEAWAANYSQDYASANRFLEHADRLLHEADLDQSPVRGEWWLAKARALNGTPDARSTRPQALQRAIALFAREKPLESHYAAAIANLASEYMLLGDYAKAKALDLEAIAAEAKLHDRDDIDTAVIYANLGEPLEMFGEIAAAERAYDTSAELVRTTTGENYGTYWRALSRHARLLHMRGDLSRSHAMFQKMLASIPPNWTQTTDDSIARICYAESLIAEDQAALAIPILEQAQRDLTNRPLHDYDLRRLRTVLGEAYEQAGRLPEARVAYYESLQDHLANEARDMPYALAIRERWERFKLNEDVADATLRTALQNLQQIIADVVPHVAFTPVGAFAHADLARIALLQGDAATASAEIAAAQSALGVVRAVHDVRDQDYLTQIRNLIPVALRSAAASAPQAVLIR